LNVEDVGTGESSLDPNSTTSFDTISFSMFQ